jgi:ParB-like chromosome segregation protein Spo0J
MPIKTHNTNTSPKETQATVTRKMLNRTKKAVDKKNRVLTRLQVEYVPIDTLKANEYNPNRQSDHDFELLLKSMKEDGFTQPILCNNDMTIVDGEHRWRVANVLGFTELPVVRVDMSEEQMRISTLRHNRARGSEDITLTAEILRDLQELGAIEWAQDSLMLDDTELNRLIDDIPAPEAYMDEEFSEAWEPSMTDEVESTTETAEERTTEGSQGEVITTAMTLEAIEQRRQYERDLKKAKSEEDRKQIKHDSNFYRLSLMFSGSEAKLVKSVLGKQPAEKLLAMCTAEVS